MRSTRTLLLLAFGLALASGTAQAAPDVVLPGVPISLGQGGSDAGQVSTALRILLGLTVLSLAPAILISVTSFMRIIVVLSMLRQALGMQNTPPNSVMMSLALFLTFFTMTPVINEVNHNAFEPFMQGKLAPAPAFDKAMHPLRDFMVRQTREQDLQLMVEIANADMPQTVNDIATVQLIPAFMLSELRSAFQIGFVVFLPFILIDLIVSTILMSLGMMMVPPVTIALPLKILMFILIDGWNLVVRALLGTFH